MQGYVLSFRPATGRGAILTPSGQTYRFAKPASGGDLFGGDVVSFEPSAHPERPRALNVELIARATACLDGRSAASLYSAVETLAR